MEFKHVSILLPEVIENLAINPEGIYVDGTLGGGGHSLAVASKLTTGRLIGIDRDKDALAAAKIRLSGVEDRVTLVKSNYAAAKEVLSELKIEKVNGILLDLGVSSYQLDNAERGFSYRFDAPLDMRMDRDEGKSAYDIVNGSTEQELRDILFVYGEERYAANIARNIIKARQEKPVATTFELVELIRRSMPAKALDDGHPAKRTFQAIRIAVNGELDGLKEALESFPELLLPGGRLCIITFHSLEDRLVKQQFKTWEAPCVCPPRFPVCACGRKSLGHVITKKPILPDEVECQENPRAKSAKLRVFERGTEPKTW